MKNKQKHTARPKKKKRIKYWVLRWPGVGFKSLVGDNFMCTPYLVEAQQYHRRKDAQQDTYSHPLSMFEPEAVR